MAFWILVALAVPAGFARAWKACGLPPFPWKACGLRFAHRRRSGAFRLLPACPHSFHGAPGCTGPAGLPTSFPYPRPLAGDRFAFSTKPAARLTANQQQHHGDGFGRAPPSLPPPAPRNANWNGLTETSLRNSERLRSKVVPQVEESEETPTGGAICWGESRSGKTVRHRWVPWAKLLLHTFGIDVFDCPKCHGRMQRIAWITQPRVIKQILNCVNQKAEPPP
jgi:hypothetical protein